MPIFTDDRGDPSIGRIVAVFVLALLLIPLVVFGLRWVTADARGAGEARERIQADGDFRIAAYQKFFDLCSAVQTQEDRARIFRERASGGDEDAQINLDAVLATRARLIREYNSEATQNYTEGQFRDSDLPYSLNPNAEETQCAA